MPEFDVRQFLTEYFKAVCGAPQVSGFTDLFTPDGVLEDPVGTPPYVGREAIGQFVATGRQFIESMEFEIRDIISCGSESAVRWSGAVLTRRGASLRIEGIGIFSFDAQHRLRHVREFYDVSMLQKIFVG